MSNDVSNLPATTNSQVSKPLNSAEKPKQQGAKKRQDGARRVRPTPVQYQVHGTVVEMSMRIGDQSLARVVKNQWEGIHHAAHYLMDFSRRSLKGKVVRAANRGVTEYLQEKMEEANEMLKNASEKADMNGIKMGKAGSVQEFVVMVASETERDVMDLIKVLDDYVIVMDSLWIGRIVDTKVRDESHDEVVRIVNKLHLLLTKMRQKMISFRQLKMTNRLTKDEEQYARELEILITDVTGIDMRGIREAEEAATAAARKASRAPKPMIPNAKRDTAAQPAASLVKAPELDTAVAA